MTLCFVLRDRSELTWFENLGLNVSIEKLKWLFFDSSCAKVFYASCIAQS